MIEKSLRQLVRRVEEWGDAFPPACGCGCGEPVRFNIHGAQKYVNRTHSGWACPHARGPANRKKRFAEERLDIRVWGQAVKKIKEQKGMTLRQLAETGGWSWGSFCNAYYPRDNMHTIGPHGVDFLRRLAGLPAPPTAYMVRRMNEIAKKQRKVERER